MIKKITLITMSAALLFSANAFSGATKAHAEKAIEKASMANSAAKKLGYEWRDTGKMIKAAKKMMAKKEYSKAIKTAKAAEDQGKLAVKQYHIETARYNKLHK